MGAAISRGTESGGWGARVVTLAALIWGLVACATKPVTVDTLQWQMEQKRQLQELEQRHAGFKQELEELRNRQKNLGDDLAREHLPPRQTARFQGEQSLIQDRLVALRDLQQILDDLLEEVRRDLKTLSRQPAASVVSDKDLEQVHREQQTVEDALARAHELQRWGRENADRVHNQQASFAQKLKEISDTLRRLADLRIIQDKLQDLSEQYRKQKNNFDADLEKAGRDQKSLYTALSRGVVCQGARTQLNQELTRLQDDLDSLLQLKRDSQSLRDARAALDNAQRILKGPETQHDIAQIEEHQRQAKAELDQASKHYSGLKEQLPRLGKRQNGLQRELANHWLCLKDPDTQKWVKVVDDYYASFVGTELEFEYLIHRERPEDRAQPGAILVRVVRMYDPNWGKRAYHRDRTILYRNKFPKKEELKDDMMVRRELYEKYHRGQTYHPTLHHVFHAKIPPNFHTNEPPNRRTQFLFHDPYVEHTAHRAYLLHYKSINTSGSRIPFYVGISDAFKKVRVTVVELNPLSGVGFFPRSIEITKK